MIRPILIGIGASHSGAGKTTLAANIFQYYARYPLLAAAHRPLRWGGLKYTRTGSPPEVIIDRDILREKGKDTCMMLAAGAEDVVWIRSDRPGLTTALSDAITRLSHLDMLIIEGNGAIEFLKPDIVIFIFGKEKERWKPDIEELAARADIIFSDDEVQLPADIQPGHRYSGDLSADNSQGFFSALTRMIMKEELKQEMLKRAADGKLSCAAARKIAEDLRVPFQDVGDAADELGIRIKNCQLGCF